MMSNDKVEQRLGEIISWEDHFFLSETNDMTTSYHYWYDRVLSSVDRKQKKKWLEKMDDLLFHLHAWYGQSRSYDETSQRIIQYARIFDEQVDGIADLRHLPLDKADYLAEQFMAKQRLLAFGQGGLTGMGGIFLLAADLPALALIQLRSLQQLALVYGYDPRRPDEMMYLLKLFHIATLPRPFQREAWEELFTKLEGETDGIFFYGEEEIFQDQAFELLLKQIAKSLAITVLRKKLIQGVPLVGMVFGAGMNYRFSQQVIEIGQHFYKKRRLLELYE